MHILVGLCVPVQGCAHSCGLVRAHTGLYMPGLSCVCLCGLVHTHVGLCQPVWSSAHPPEVRMSPQGLCMTSAGCDLSLSQSPNKAGGDHGAPPAGTLFREWSWLLSQGWECLGVPSSLEAVTGHYPWHACEPVAPGSHFQPWLGPNLPSSARVPQTHLFSILSIPKSHGMLCASSVTWFHPCLHLKADLCPLFDVMCFCILGPHR